MTLSRRTFAFSSLAAAANAQPSLIRRYIDPSTEHELYCLSDPNQIAALPFPCNRCAASRQNFLIYSLSGPQGVQAYRLELKGGALKPLTAAAALHPRALALSPDDKTLYFTDGDRLLATASSSLSKPRELYRATSPEVWSRGFSLCEDGSTLTFFDGAKLMALNPKTPGKPTPQVITEANPEATEALAFKGNQVIFRDPQKGFHAYFPALGPKPLRLSLEGQFGPAYWNPDGRSFLFLRTNQGPGKANSLHEYSFDTKQESLVGRTSQFVHFNRNADSSVFVGASGSKAQPYLLLMLRITRRELALCEHKASDATMVAPVFSPSSKRVFFVTDRLGKPAIFSMMVDRLVEPTEADEPEKKS